MQLFADANFNFLGLRQKAVRISGAVLILFLAAAVFWQVRAGAWVDYGIDFTGGTLVQVHFEEPTTEANLRMLLEPYVPGAEITRFGAANEYLIRAAAFAEGAGGVREAVVEGLNAGYQPDQYTIARAEGVGPRIGAELQRRALLAITVSFLLVLIYLAIRFEWRFGVAAIIAAMHDILITLGLISLFRLEVSLPTVAAVLTIIGYSLNDTIVVFDRVRENMKKFGRKISHIDLLNRSINEVLPRTVVTSGTTLAALFALFFIGGAIIREFALILIVGIMIGTYSSIFIAAPALLEIEKRWGEAGSKGKPGGRGGSRRAGAGERGSGARADSGATAPV